ncbi:hypothetical protein P692DRAFT_20455416 [Suillus brevipes Sb2]|nr:hypothetical protein P692DRAFT_20455416 [Suillus brevipes Sb2]
MVYSSIQRLAVNAAAVSLGFLMIMVLDQFSPQNFHSIVEKWRLYTQLCNQLTNNINCLFGLSPFVQLSLSAPWAVPGERRRIALGHTIVADVYMVMNA